jgi:MSHA biogenesis protein MshL
MTSELRLHPVALAALITVLLGACAEAPPRREPLASMEAALGVAPAPAAGRTAVPADVADALVPSLKLTVPSVPDLQDAQRFDISVNNVPAPQFFMSLVDGTSYNMVVHPEVSGSISLTLRNTTIPGVLEAARDVYGYQFVRTTYGFQVLPSRLEARVYQVNFLNVNRRGSSSTFVSSGTLQEGPSTVPTTPEENALNPSGARGQRTTVGTQISTEQPETSFWNELHAALVAIVGDAQGRSVVVNPQSGVVVVRAIPNELREVETFLRASQLIAQRQVILEAKILEVELSKAYQTGINWVALAGDVSALHTGGGRAFDTHPGRSEIEGLPIGLPSEDVNLAGKLASAFGGVFGLAINADDFKGFIEFLETQGNVQVLSSPRIATMNNQKAIIKVGTDEFFVTDVSTTTITGTATTSTPDIELTPFFSGIALDVTPQISETNDVTLHIHPTVSDVVDQQKTITISNVEQTLPLARSTVRESDSIVRARNGQIVVIGGLMQNRIDDGQAKTPRLGDLPFIGGLFKHQRESSVKSELVILLKPIVVDGEAQWAEAIEGASEGLARVRSELDGWRQRRSGGFPEAPIRP